MLASICFFIAMSAMSFDMALDKTTHAGFNIAGCVCCILSGIYLGLVLCEYL